MDFASFTNDDHRNRYEPHNRNRLTHSIYIYKCHGLRIGRESIRFASSSPMMTSFSGSHFSFLPVSIAISPNSAGVSDRCATSAGVIVSRRLFTQSRKF